MLWLTIGIAVVIAALALIYVVAPLRKPATPLPSEDDDRLADLVARKESVLRAIKETEFDYHTGKLSEEDYARYDERLRRQAISLIQQIEKIAPEADSLDSQLEAQIAKMRKVRTNGAVMVTTPQEVALMDVYKAVSMCQKVGIPITGIVENESYFVCDGCDKRHELFGSGGGQKVAELAGAPLLGQIPLHPDVRKWGDAGTPVVQASPGSEIAKAFIEVADRLVEEIERQNTQAQGLSIDRTGGVNKHLPITR